MCYKNQASSGNVSLLRLVDEAVSAQDDEITSDASDALLSYIDGEGRVENVLVPSVMELTMAGYDGISHASRGWARCVPAPVFFLIPPLNQGWRCIVSHQP